jgi:hypothetical protein
MTASIKTKILRQDLEVDIRLNWFGVSQKDLHRIIFEAIGARANHVPHDPANAGGLLSYIFGTRALRGVFCQKKGWVINRSGNIESVYHPEKGIKVIFQNADSACDPDRDPGAISDKGPAAAKVVELGQGTLFPEYQKEEEAEQTEGAAAAWYFFVHTDGTDVTAELSWPKAIDDRQFKGFNERIFIVESGEWADIELSDLDADAAGDEYDVEVTRKK